MTWSDVFTQWGVDTASRLCVSHSESIAKLGGVVSEMSIKTSEGWNLMCWLMVLHNPSWCSISFIPHYSFHLALPYTFLSLLWIGIQSKCISNWEDMYLSFQFARDWKEGCTAHWPIYVCLWACVGPHVWSGLDQHSPEEIKCTGTIK